MAKKKNKRKGTLTRHHRIPKSKGGTFAPENISNVPHHKHKAFHLLFHNWSVYTIAKILNEVWIDKDYILVVKPRKEVESG